MHEIGKNEQNLLAAGAPPQTPLGELMPKLHYSDFPVTFPRGHETGKSLTCRQLVTDLLRTCPPTSCPRGEVPGKLTILTCRDGLPCRGQVRDKSCRVVSL